jgi:hypothetical protein
MAPLQALPDEDLASLPYGSLIWPRRMAIPWPDRQATNRSRVQQAKGRPSSVGRVGGAVMTALR